MDVPDEELQTNLAQEVSLQQCQIDSELAKNRPELERRLLQHIPDVPDTEQRPMPSFTAEGIRWIPKTHTNTTYMSLREPKSVA